MQVIKNFIQNLKTSDAYAQKILWLAIILFIVFFSLILIWKYNLFGYNALDLAIYNQVFYNTSFGRLFQFTIHPHSYLGDHLELIIVLLTPFYALFRHPITLLILQTIFLGISAWPLYLIARQRLGRELSLLVAIAYLFNPFLHNINLFEFHILPFSMFFIFWSFYFYQKNRFIHFVIFILLALTVREDVSLIIIMWGFLAALEKKSAKWILFPLALGSLWLVGSLKITGYLNQYGQYKFLRYYQWLGPDLLSMINNFFAHPIYVLKNTVHWGLLGFLVASFLPLAYLPLLKIKYLLPLALVFLQIFLLGTPVEIVLTVHYMASFLPFLFIALVFAFDEIFYQKKKKRIAAFFAKQKDIFIVLFLTVTIGSTFIIGPIVGLAKKAVASTTYQNVSLKKDFTKMVSPDASLVAGYEFLTPLSSREKLYSAHYVFLGKKQYSDEPYILPEDADTILLNFYDFLMYEVIYHPETNKEYLLGDNRLRQIIKERNFKLIKVIDNLGLYQQGTTDEGIKLYQIGASLPDQLKTFNKSLNNEIKFIGFTAPSSNGNQLLIKKELLNNHQYQTIPLTFYWQALKNIESHYQYRLKYLKNGKLKAQRYYPMGWGLYPTTEWQPQKILKTNHWFSPPTNLESDQYELRLEVVKMDGFLGPGKVRSVVDYYRNIKPVGEEISLGLINL